MELWDNLDMERTPTGYFIERGGEYPTGALHLVIHACIFNSKGEMLIQQRQPFKEGWSNMWDVTVGGSALAGEKSQQAIMRELGEEIGYHIDLSGVRPNFTINFERGFDDWYLISQEVDLSTLSLQYEEVKAVKWATKDNILAMIDDTTFIPYYKSFIEMLFDVRTGRGMHSTNKGKFKK